MALKPVKVSQLNKYIGRVMQTDPILGNVSVIGEISNLKYHSTGHVYFTLKDDASRINCFLSARIAAGLRYRLADGMEIIASGYVGVYEKGGYYSLNVRDVQVSGEGELAAAYRAMYDRLLREGLFDAAHKKKLPAFPKKICIITSPTGAAVRDIIKIIKSRNDTADVILYPCLVQGEAAAPDIAAAIDNVNKKFNDVDVIITGRGGGSLEDLWAFNEEAVARSIYASAIPVISAVGHETDFAISDYVADVRAETPTAAAMMAAPDTFMLREAVTDMKNEISRRAGRIVGTRAEALERYTPRMLSVLFSRRVVDSYYMTERSVKELKTGMQSRISLAESALDKFKTMLYAGDPERIINRGYAIVRDDVTGEVISDAGALSEGMRVTIHMRGGDAGADITGVK